MFQKFMAYQLVMAWSALSNWNRGFYVPFCHVNCQTRLFMFMKTVSELLGKGNKVLSAIIIKPWDKIELIEIII